MIRDQFQNGLVIFPDTQIPDYTQTKYTEAVRCKGELIPLEIGKKAKGPFLVKICIAVSLFDNLSVMSSGVSIFYLSIIGILIVLGVGVYRLIIAAKGEDKNIKNLMFVLVPFFVVVIGIWFCYNLAISLAY